MPGCPSPRDAPRICETGSVQFRFSSVRYSSGRVWFGQVGSIRFGSVRFGSCQVGSGRVGSGRVRSVNILTSRVLSGLRENFIHRVESSWVRGPFRSGQNGSSKTSSSRSLSDTFDLLLVRDSEVIEKADSIDADDGEPVPIFNTILSNFGSRSLFVVQNSMYESLFVDI